MSETLNKTYFEQPLISCVCITRGKPAFLKRAVLCFLFQTYMNKELVIIFEDDDESTKSFLKDEVFPDNVKIFEIGSKPKLTLGDLRNIGISKSLGNYICQWDDDDWFHSERLSLQYSSLVGSGKKGSILTHWSIFDSVKTRVFLSHKRNWEGSILCEKDTLTRFKYLDVWRGEDTAVIDGLLEENLLLQLDNLPHLYIYIWHKNNTWSENHFDEIFKVSTSLSFENEVLEILADTENFTLENSMKIEKYLNKIFE